MTKHVCVACYNRKLGIFVMFVFFSRLIALKESSKKLLGQIVLQKRKRSAILSSVLGRGEEMYFFYQFQQSLIAPAGSLRYPSRITNQFEIRAQDIEVRLILNGKILSTSESNEVSLLRNFPFFVNISRNMSVVDWLVSPAGGACGASKCTCGRSGICENIINY